jgi:hypothetical protein
MWPLAFVQRKPRISLGVWSWKSVWIEFDLQLMTQRCVHDSVCCTSDSKMLRCYMTVYRYVYGLSQNSFDTRGDVECQTTFAPVCIYRGNEERLYNNSFVKKPKYNMATGRWKVHMEQNPSWEANRFSASQVISPRFTEPEGSLPHSQEPATCPYSQPDQSSPCPPSHVLMIHFNITLPSTSGPTKWSFLLRFPHQNSV